MARKHREQSRIYSRRNPLNSNQKNASSESTAISSSINESSSTITANLSLTPSSKVSPGYFTKFSPLGGPILSGEKESTKGDVGKIYEFYEAAGPLVGRVVVNVDHQIISGQNSDSNSEVSASESVSNKKYGENETCNDKIINLPFIDFLGVGA